MFLAVSCTVLVLSMGHSVIAGAAACHCLLAAVAVVVGGVFFFASQLAGGGNQAGLRGSFF